MGNGCFPESGNGRPAMLLSKGNRIHEGKEERNEDSERAHGLDKLISGERY